jgi:predicted MFS family arabinose efflux permease
MNRMSDADPAAAPTFSRGYRAWLLFLLMVVNALNLADRQGMAATAPAIKAEFHLSDTQLGLIQGLGFAIFYTLLGLPIARLAEVRSRTKIIAVSTLIFAAMVAACGTARNFFQFLGCRIGVAIGDAGFGPPVSSLLGDHYPVRRRASALTIIWLGAPIGALAGSALGGWVAQNADWRTWFYLLSIPGVLVAIAAFFTLRDPPRGFSDPAGTITAGAPPPPMREVLRFLFAKKSMRHILIGAALASMAMNGVGQFLARFIVAQYDVGFAEAGRTVGLIAVVAMASGLALGGFGMDWASKFDRRWYAWGPAIGLVVAAPMFMLAVTQPSLRQCVPLLLAGHVTLFIYYTPTLAMGQNMVGASMRASSAFVISLVLGLVGIGLGPTLIGILSDILAASAFGGDYGTMCPGGSAPAASAADLVARCSDASAAGITRSIVAVSVLFAWAALHYLLASRHLVADLDRRYEGPAKA